MTIQSFVQSFIGSSFPTLAVLDSGTRVVIKMRGSGNGVSCLLAEYIVNRISANIGLPVPDVRLVNIPEGFPWNFGTDEFDDIVQKSFGINLGIELIPEAKPWAGKNFSELDRWTTLCMLAIDLLFLNVDRTISSKNILVDAVGKIWLVDHGSCVFLRSPGFAREKLPGLALLKQKAELKQDVKGIMRDLSDVDRLREVLQTIPDEWLQHEGLDQAMILKRIKGISDKCFAEL